MTRVLLTGGTGKIGKATAERLLQDGFEVRAIDLAAESDIAGVDYRRCDILNYADLGQQMQGCDAVIHLAAIRSPSYGLNHDVFRVNAAGTFNVFEAAAAAGIRRIAQASSINALGCFFNLGDFAPGYLPIDEAHPSSTTDAYSFSKETIEAIGAYYWRRDGISSVALRFPGVHDPGYPQSETARQRRADVHRVLDDLAGLPEAERAARLAAVRAKALAFRTLHPFEIEAVQQGVARLNYHDDPLLAIYVYSRFDLWTWLDVRDAAQALVKGITAVFEGDHVLYVNDHRNAAGYDASTLARLFYPSVTEIRGDLSGTAALVSIEKARRLIGFEPEYSLAET